MMRSAALFLAAVAVGFCAFVAGAGAQQDSGTMSPGVQAQGGQSSSPAAAQTPAQKPFVDMFAVRADPNWGPNDGYSHVFGGKFQFHVPARQHAERYTLAYTGTTLDLQANFQTRPGTSAGAAAGLVFWADRKHDAKTLFLVDAVAGRFAVFSAAGGTLTPVVAWKPAHSIHDGPAGMNLVQVVAGAKETAFFINGKQVHQMPTPAAIAGPLVGLYVAGGESGGANFEFSTFIAQAPEAEPSATPAATKTGVASAWDYINGSLSTPATAQQMIPTFDSPRLPLGVGPGQTLFTDDFKTLDRDWGTTNEDSYVKDGRFEFHPPAKMEVERYSNKYTLTDVDFGADVVAGATAKADTIAGLSFWADGSDDTQTLFLVNPITGNFAIQGEAADKITPILDWGSSPLIRIGIGKTNRLEVIVAGKLARFLINGHQVAQMAVPSKLPGGLIGLYASGSDTDPGDFAFSSFSAKIPVASSLPPGTVAAPPTAPGKTIFADDFKSLDPSWGVTGAAISAKDGRLTLASDDANDAIYLVNGKYAYGEADVSAAITEKAGGPPDTDYGLLFWSADDNDYVVFVVEPETGIFAVFRRDLGKTTTLLDWTNTHALEAAPGKTNRLGVAMRNDKAFLLINGRQVGELPKPASPPGALVGVAVEAGAKAATTFDIADFSVTAPTGEGPPQGVTVEPSAGLYVAPSVASTAPPAPNAGPGSVIFSDDFKSFDPSWGAPDAASSAKDGRLRFRAEANGSYTLVNGKYAYGEADVSASFAEEAGGPSDALYGLLFWAADDDNYVLFVVQPATGIFAVFRQDQDKSTTLLNWTNTHALEATPGKTNRIGVALRKDRALLLINGRQVGEVPAQAKPAGGLIGVYGEAGVKAPATFDISELSVTVPNGEEAPQGITVEPPAGSYGSPAAAAPAPNAAPGTIIFSDDFKSLDPSWGEASESTFARDGRLEIRTQPGWETDEVNEKYAYKQADISVDVTAETGTAPRTTQAGLLFWTADSQNYVLFDVNPETSKFAVFREHGGKSTTLIHWRATTLLDAGIGKTNRLGVALREDKAVLMINGHQVAVVPAPPDPAGGLIGLYGDAGQDGAAKVAYSNFAVVTPSGSDLPPGTQPAPAVEPGGTVLADDFKALDPAWGIANGSGFVRDGKLELRSASDEEIVRLNNKYSVGQGEVDASVVEEGNGVYGPLAGLLFWASDAYNYTLFAVDPISGKFAAFQETDDKSTTLTHWTPTTALDTGVGKTNRIGVQLQADRAILLVNGRQVGEIPMPAGVPGGLVGVYGEGDKNTPGNFDYSDFAIKVLPANGAADSGGAAQTASADTGPASSQNQASSQVEASSQASGAATASAASAATATPSEGSASPSSDTTAPQVPSASGDAPPAEAALPAPRTPAAGEELALADDFSELRPSWGTPDKQIFAQDGHLVMQISKQGFAYRMNGAYFYYDADISFAAQVTTADSTEAGVELIFWGQDLQNYYYLYVGNSGHFRVMRLAGGKTAEVVALSSSPAIKIGPGQWNAIELLIRGKKATLSINGTRVAAFSGAPPALGGAIGLAGYSGSPGGATAAFANLVVSVPKPAALRRGWTTVSSARPAPAPTAAPGQIIAADDFTSFDPSWGRPDGIVEVRNGSLAMEARGGGTAGILSYKYLYGDADIRVDAMLVESSRGDTAATLYFWGDARTGDLYLLSVSPLGYIRVAHRAGGKTEDVIKWQTTQALAQGTGKWNDIGVALRGGQGTVLINGKAVGRFTGQPPSAGGLIGAGMLASKAGISVWDFGKLRVSSPADQAGQ